MGSLDVTRARDSIEDATRSAWHQLESSGAELADRAVHAKGELGQRAEQARDMLNKRIDDMDLEPKVRRAKIGFWTGMRAVLGALFAVPGVVARSLGSLSEVADDAVERGSELSARSREVIRAVPVTRAARRRAKARTAAWAVGGFAVGALAGAIGGYVLARRQPELVDDAWDTARSASEHAREVAADKMERARDIAADGLTKARQAMEEGGDQAAHAGDAIDAAADDAAASVGAAAERMSSGNGESGAAAERGVDR